ncbi:MAG TPA: phosphoenolpyruvate carboxylase [Thermoanaerobaculia bacterium]|nr:phosphoenolpyruvate carboxylase [Thermoanaerobaculia bacterium]
MKPTDQPLRDDIHLLGDLLGETLRAQEGEDLFQMVERVRALSKSDFGELARLLASRPADEALPIARAFAHFLNLANIAEQHHRVRRRRDYQRDPKAAPQPGSCAAVFGELRADGISATQLFETVTSLRIELVFTAHPTEVMRRTLLQKQRRVAQLLAEREHRDVTEELRREITSAWETDEVRRQQPTPLDEVKGGLFVFEQTLWDALPQYLRTLDAALREHTGRELPLEAVPIRFGSWIGGDRDGNPNVTAEVTKKACLLSRWMAADLYLRDIEELRIDLSVRRGSPELERLAGCTEEPYREVLKKLRDRLRETRDSIEELLERTDRIVCPPLMQRSDVLEPLMTCWRSLHETGNGILAGGRLLDMIRRAHCFGTTLVRLDIRQDSARHADPEPDDLDTFRAIEEIPAESLGAYVITMTRNAGDVLRVHALQKRLRIVPLFETIDDLRNAGQTLARLFADDDYRKRIDGRQEVMVGYSDSAKDAGRFAAAWELFQAQERIVAACREAGVELTLFHGRGGSVGRGGGPTYLAIQSQPPGSVDGRLRVTVQGEMIQAEFGLIGIALRTLEVYTTATLGATLQPAAEPSPEWRQSIQRMADASARAYRKVVYERPEFLDYFRAATPEVELGLINIGSRPARRGGAKKGVESLRAIPWQFAWTQNRLLLPSWLGVEEALSDWEAAAEMVRHWPFLRSMVELIEMVLAKTEAHIAEYYDRVLVPDELRPLGEELRARLSRTVDAVVRVTGHDQLLKTNHVLRRSIAVRNPYVDPINVVQAEILRRYRQSGDESLRDAFVVTVNGIAAGMRNTG